MVKHDFSLQFPLFLPFCVLIILTVLPIRRILQTDVPSFRRAESVIGAEIYRVKTVSSFYVRFRLRGMTVSIMEEVASG